MTLASSHRTRIRRLPERGNYDSETINKIIDSESRVWAGVVPITSVQGEPEADPGLAEGIPLPRYLRSDHGEQ